MWIHHSMKNLFNNHTGDWYDFAECAIIKTSNSGIPDMDKPKQKGEFRYVENFLKT